MLELPPPPRIWPTFAQRVRWAWGEIPELRNFRKAVTEGALPTVVSLFLLRRFLSPQDWKQEAIIAVVSLVAGLLVVPVIRFGVNLWRAPRQLVQKSFSSVWAERSGLRQQLVKAQATLDIEVEIEAGPFPRPAQIGGITLEQGATVYSLQNVIITNLSDSNVSLAFQLCVPSLGEKAWLMLWEHEYSGMGRTDPRYAKSPLNIGPKSSSECKDLGFICLPGADALFGAKFEHDLKRSVLRVVDRVTKKRLEVPVQPLSTIDEFFEPPGWPKPPGEGGGEILSQPIRPV